MLFFSEQFLSLSVCYNFVVYIMNPFPAPKIKINKNKNFKFFYAIIYQQKIIILNHDSYNVIYIVFEIFCILITLIFTNKTSEICKCLLPHTMLFMSKPWTETDHLAKPIYFEGIIHNFESPAPYQYVKIIQITGSMP